MASKEGHIYGIADLGDLGLTKGSYFLGCGIRSSPALADHTLYIGCDNGYLYAFGP
jgi:outer membrane protein assembly factor BamB